MTVKAAEPIDWTASVRIAAWQKADRKNEQRLNFSTTKRIIHMNAHDEHQEKKRFYIKLGCGIFAGLVVAAFLFPPPPPAPRPNLRQLYPEYYSVLSGDDSERDRCIVETGFIIRARSNNYVALAAEACDAPAKIMRQQQEESDARTRAALLRPR